jgi:hypothetical protein
VVGHFLTLEVKLSYVGRFRRSRRLSLRLT